MADKIGFFDEAFEQGGKIVKQTAKQIAGAPAAGVKTAMNQVAPGLTPQVGDEASENSPDNKKSAQKKPRSSPTSNLRQQIKPTPQKAAEEQVKLQKIRQELHSSYYQNLVNRPKPKDERAAEKVEREEKEEEQEKFVEEEKKKKKELPINVRQGTGEKLTGIGG